MVKTEFSLNGFTQVSICVDAGVVKSLCGHDRMGVKIAIMATQTIDHQRARTIAHSYIAIKHPGDEHNCETALKQALTEVLKQTQQRKDVRSDVWNHMRTKFNFLAYAAEYYKAMRDYQRETGKEL